jgi:predicted transcriptional regulator of viral defense system
MKPRFYLPNYLEQLQADGKIVFTIEEALESLQVGRGPFLDSAERLMKDHRLISPRQGFYLIVPTRFKHMGAPPPSWYIDDLMKYEGKGYYVGLLKAAEIHGASHQAVMEYQVLTNKRIPRLQIGRSILSFYYRKELMGLHDFTLLKKSETGSFRISSIELTLLDLLRYPQASGGIDAIASIFSDLAEQTDIQRFRSLAPLFETNIIQRAGFLLEYLGYSQKSTGLHHYLESKSRPSWTELTHSKSSSLDYENLVQEPSDLLERNKRWNIIVRRYPEVDE